MKGKNKHSVCILAALLGIGLFFHPILFSRQTFFLRDIHPLFYPMKYFLAHAFKDGFLPYWCRYYFCGAPFLGDIQSGVFYPPSILFWMFPFPWSLNIYVVLHIFLGFIFFYLFIRSLGLSNTAGIITGFSYAFGGFTIASVNTLNNLSTCIWLPAMLWSFHTATARKSVSRYFLTILFFCLGILGGEPQLLLLNVALVVLSGVILLPGRESGRAAYLKYGWIVMVLFTAAVVMTLMQLGPTYIDYRNSHRLGGITYEEATRLSLHWGMLKHLVMPLHFSSDFVWNRKVFFNFYPIQWIPWLLTIYPGFLIAPMALIGTVFRFSQKHLFWLILFIISVVFALGRHTPIYHLFYQGFPFFRHPEKFMCFAGFSLLVLSAYGIDYIVGALRSKGIDPVRYSVIFFFLLVADLYFSHAHINPTVDRQFYTTIHPDMRPVLEDPGDFRIHVDLEKTVRHETLSFGNIHLVWQKMMVANLGVLHGVSQVGGTLGLLLNYQYIITEILSKPWPERLTFLKLCNVKYIVSVQRLHEIPQLSGEIEKLNDTLYRVKNPLPRAWMLGRLHPVQGDIIKALTRQAHDPRVSGLVSQSVASKFTQPFFKAVDRIDYQKDGSIQIQVTAERPAVLFVSEAAYPGWRVFVDGKETQPLRINLIFQGVAVDKGTHRVRFVFKPVYFNLFAVISISSCFLFAICWSMCVFFVKQRKTDTIHGTFMETGRGAKE